MSEKLYELDGMRLPLRAVVRVIGNNPDDLVGRALNGRVSSHYYVRGYLIPLDTINAAYGFKKNTLKHRMAKGMSLAEAVQVQGRESKHGD